MSSLRPTPSCLSQVDPPRQITVFPHGSRSVVQETTSPPQTSELKRAGDVDAAPSREWRGGVAYQDGDYVDKGPGVDTGSPAMGGSRHGELGLLHLANFKTH